jgi:hypothetical protein
VFSGGIDFSEKRVENGEATTSEVNCLIEREYVVV